MGDFNNRTSPLCINEYMLLKDEYKLNDPADRLTSIYWINIFQDHPGGKFIKSTDAMYIGFNNYNWIRPFPFKKRHN